MVNFSNEELAMLTALEPIVQSPDVYRSTPFEYFSTADTGESVVVCATPIAGGHSWIAQAGTVLVRPAIPAWMAARLNVAPQAPPLVEPFELTLPE
jgi:hypothetical protein